VLGLTELGCGCTVLVFTLDLHSIMFIGASACWLEALAGVCPNGMPLGLGLGLGPNDTPLALGLGLGLGLGPNDMPLGRLLTFQWAL
jgi:hypothetical protein